jgi:hypothetical protein
MQNAIRPMGTMTACTVTESGATLAQRDPDPRRLGATYAMRV